MTFFLDKQETTQRFSGAMAEFRSLLDTNHIRHGSPDDMFEFARTLEHSNQFRLDLSALVKSIVKRERDELLLTDMMSIIAASVGGQSVADTHTDITRPTNVLMEFLLGTGCWRQFGSPSRPGVQSVASPPQPSLRIDEANSIRASVPAPPIVIAKENPEDRATLLDISSELRETLIRLEGSAEQVKLHLDSIERRIGNLEPAPEVLPVETPLVPDPLVPDPLIHRISIEDVARKKNPQFRTEDIPAPDPELRIREPELPVRGRAIFSQFMPEEEAQADSDDFSSPTFSYAAEKGRSIVPVVIFLLLLAIVVVFLFFAHSGAIRALFNRVPASAAHIPTATQPPTVGPTSPATSAASPTPSPENPSSTPEAVSGAAPTHSMEPDSGRSNVSPGARSVLENRRGRYVPANVMEGYLLSAPRPEYPPSARIDHIEGQVALQATISPTGSIETLHVIKGPQRLRGAALDAVRNWRYKPYSFNGERVEVSTTVYVDFTLRPPPEIAH